jgi:NADPH dehydrogenase (quinone)
MGKKAAALIINGAEIHKPAASGRLNTLLFETLRHELKPSHTVLTTVLQDGYDIAIEQQKFQKADLIIFQTPIFWFSLPSSFKRYIDEVYKYGVFFGPSLQYGRGGFLTGKTYFLSSTWNAKLTDFGTASGFLGERTPDDLLVGFHLTQQYVGMQPLASFSEFDVVAKPDPDGAVNRLKQHLEKYIVGRQSNASAR